MTEQVSHRPHVEQQTADHISSVLLLFLHLQLPAQVANKVEAIADYLSVNKDQSIVAAPPALELAEEPAQHAVFPFGKIAEATTSIDVTGFSLAQATGLLNSTRRFGATAREKSKNILPGPRFLN